jgi:hypothetical protein
MVLYYNSDSKVVPALEEGNTKKSRKSYKRLGE